MDCGRFGFGGRGGEDTALDADAVSGEQVLGVVLVQIEKALLFRD